MKFQTYDDQTKNAEKNRTNSLKKYIDIYARLSW